MSAAKRALDVVGAAAGLILLSPAILAAAALVRAKMGAPVLFRQERAGLGGRPFRVVKLRTMTDARDAQGRLLPDEARIPPLGAFLRRTTLDEMPALWNVLKGDMSLVGPRPLHLKYVERYSSEQRRRLDAKPGLTGWAVVRGRNALSWEERFRLDVWYVDHQSLALDLRILARTVGLVLGRKGVSAEGHATMPEFEGSGKA